MSKQQITCPVCGYFETQIQQSNKKPDCIKRVRMCMNCGHVFKTVEPNELSNNQKKKRKNENKGAEK